MTEKQIKENIANNGPAVYYNFHENCKSIRVYLFDISKNYIWARLFRDEENVPFQPTTNIKELRDNITEKPLYEIKEE